MVGNPNKFGRGACWTTVPETPDDLLEVNMKIYSAFAGVTSFPFKRSVLQFWRPQMDHASLVLQCLRNPYAVSTYNLGLRKYRSCCIKYRYSTVHEGGGDNYNNNPPWFISSGGPVVASFLSHFPEVVLDLRVLQGSPIVDCALECDLTCCVMLPVFHVDSSDCVGVVECSMKHPSLLLPLFNELKRELQRTGLCIYHVQGSWPYKEAIAGDLEPVKIEIENGLKIACESHDLTLAQVWISYESDHHALDTKMIKRMFLVKFSGYSVVDSDDDPLSSVKDFYDKLDVIYLKTGEGLARKTLQTHQPHLCRNIYKLSDNCGILALLSANTKSKCASFVICLRSTHTRELDYAFEFFWLQSRNHLILLDGLLVTLRKYLPSFKFASGEQLGDELSVVEVDNSSSSSRLVKVLSGNELSEALRTSVGMKRKSIAGQSELNHQESEDDDDLAILASYRNKSSLFYVPSSSTFEDVLEKLHRELELDQARTYKVEYKVSASQWSSLVCLESCRSMDLIRLRVLPEGREVGWLWRTN